MMRATVNLIVGSVTVVSLVASGWCCGFMPAAPISGDETAALGGHDIPAMPDNSMPDRQRHTANTAATVSACVDRCAVPATVAPAMVRTVTAQIAELQYPAQPAWRSWIIQPEPHPPRV